MKTESGLEAPNIHLNGTSREYLQTCLKDAHGALDQALDKLGATAPNARDYYVVGDGAYALARAQHNARVESIAQVQKQLFEIWEATHNG